MAISYPTEEDDREVPVSSENELERDIEEGGSNNETSKSEIEVTEEVEPEIIVDGQPAEDETSDASNQHQEEKAPPSDTASPIEEEPASSSSSAGSPIQKRHSESAIPRLPGGCRFPKAFYCPVTGEIMRDPVVAPDGESYSKNGIQQKDPNVTCYPNRALKAYIEKELSRQREQQISRSESEGSSPDWEGSLRQGWNQLLETAALPFSERRPLPDAFYCPITFEYFFEPVIEPDGNTYEQDALLSWIRANGNSPVSRKPLDSTDLYKNKAVLRVMLELSEGDENALPPPLQRWRQELKKRPHAHAPLDFEMIPASYIPSSGEQGHSFTHQHQLQQNSRYPTTQEELNAIRRRSVTVLIVGIFFAALFSVVLYIFSPRYFLFFIVLASMFYCLKMAQARRRSLVRARRMYNGANSNTQNS